MSDTASGYRFPGLATKSKSRKRVVPAALADDGSATSSGPPTSGRWFRVIECGVDAGGALRLRPREYLNRGVYDRSTTFRFLVIEAKKLTDSQSIGVTDEQGRLAHLFAGKTGRFASKDAKKLVAAKLLVDGIGSDQPAPPEPKKKRTSRPPGTARVKRTSRKKEPGEASTAAKRTSRRAKPRAAAAPAPVERSSIWNP